MSNTGTWMQRVAQDWLVLELAVGSGATALGITTGLQFLPFLLLTPFAGLVADRAYVIEKGRIRYSGSMAELAANDAVRAAYLSV